MNQKSKQNSSFSTILIREFWWREAKNNQNLISINVYIWLKLSYQPKKRKEFLWNRRLITTTSFTQIWFTSVHDSLGHHLAISSADSRYIFVHHRPMTETESERTWQGFLVIHVVSWFPLLNHNFSFLLTLTIWCWIPCRRFSLFNWTLWKIIGSSRGRNRNRKRIRSPSTVESEKENKKKERNWSRWRNYGDEVAHLTMTRCGRKAFLFFVFCCCNSHHNFNRT